MQAVVPAHKLFTLGKRLVARTVDRGMRFSHALPERCFFVGHVFLVDGNCPAVGQPLKPGAFGRGQAAHNVLSVCPVFRNEFPFLAIARSGAFIVGGVQRPGFVAAVGNDVGIVGDTVFMIAGDIGADLTVAIPRASVQISLSAPTY